MTTKPATPSGGPIYREKSIILDAVSLDRTLTRLAHQILEHQEEIDQVVLIGIRSRGDVLAKRLAQKIFQIEGIQWPVGSLDITRHRDDQHGEQKKVVASAIPGSLAGRTIVLIDDVLYTGRSVRAALDALVEFGRPARIQLAVLIDRGHREFPIRADYVGKNVPTSQREDVQVKLTEADGEDIVMIREAAV